MERVLPAKVCLWGIIFSLIFLSVWLYIFGLGFWKSLLYLVFVIILFVGITRIVVEGGIAETKTPISPPTLLISVLGSNLIGPAGLAVLGTNFVYAADTRSLFITSSAHGLKLWGENSHSENMKFVFALLIAALVAFLSLVIFRIYRGYRIGMLNYIFIPDILNSYNFIHHHIANPQGPYWQGIGLMIQGGLITALFMFLHQRFLWWPIHPLGLPISAIWLTHQIWFSIFLAWGIKTLMLRYGGPQLYKKSTYFFLGLILGQFITAAVWFFIDKLTGSLSRGLIFWL